MAGRDVFRGHRITRWPVVLVAIASAAISSIASRSTAGVVIPSGCTSIQNVPVQYSIEYGAAIQGLFDNFSSISSAGCTDCHFAIADGPAGNLDLTPGFSWGDLVNVASSDDPTLTYVVPNHPEQSLLFAKVNCDNPGLDARMPLDNYGGGLSVEQQALIYDWIAAGAPITTTDGIFRNSFDIRGFDQ
jgi:hypothetical protein